MIKDIFKITYFFDSARWENIENYNLINFCPENLSNDSKILTHWLCYITDRQMPFKKVWDVGGFIFSQLVNKIKKSKDLGLLNPDQTEKSFFIRRESYSRKDQFEAQDSSKFLFVSCEKVGENKRLPDYGFEQDTVPYFISRYYPSDYRSILSTFCVLRDYDYNFTKYVIDLLNKTGPEEERIRRLLFGLYLLSYYDIRQPNASQLEYGKELTRAEKRAQEVKKIICDAEEFEKKFKPFSKTDMLRQKRAWCSLRDFLKSPEFSKYFCDSLKEQSFEDIEVLKSDNSFKQLELPGDVWNNNPKFRSCIFKGTKYEKVNTSLSELLRTIFSEEQIESGYPEQFDITFDFVPRMCEVNNCSICPYGVIKKASKDFDKICINNKTKYCSVALTCCNYKIICKGEECSLLNLLKNYRREQSVTSTPDAG